LLSIAAPDALAVDLDRMRESYDTKLRAHQKRITEIEARGRGASARSGEARGRDHAGSARRNQGLVEGGWRRGQAPDGTCREGVP
jgi:hypothetical protein